MLCKSLNFRQWLACQGKAVFPERKWVANAASQVRHVPESELPGIWNETRAGDVLVFYQHQTNRSGTPWIEPKKAQFERALAIDAGSAGMMRAVEIARDVAFFFVEKSKATRRAATSTAQ